MPASCHKTLHQCTMPPQWEINDEVKTKSCCCSLGELRHKIPVSLQLNLQKNCKLKILPAYFVTTKISVFLHFLLSTLFLTQKSKLTPAAAGRIFQRLLMYNLELSCQNKQKLSENTTLDGYDDINRDSDINRM